MRIVPFEAHHLQAVALLEEMAGVSGWTRAHWQRELELERSCFLVAEAPPTLPRPPLTGPAQVDRRLFLGGPSPSRGEGEGEGDVIGYAGFWSVDGEAQILNVVVHPDWRRKGLGRQLLQFLLAEALRRGCHRAVLDVAESNRAARALYGSAGFQEVGQRPRYYPDQVDAVLMQKEIA